MDKIKFGSPTIVTSLDTPIAKFANKTVSKKYQALIAYNSGNLLINEYFKKNIIFEEVQNANSADKIVSICANILRPNMVKEWPHMFKISPQLKSKQRVILGVGAQATFDQMKPKEYVKLLEPELIEWFHNISDCCESIGVRGEFTADVLKEMGINNVSVIGCPTWYANGYSQPDIIKKDWSYDLKPACYTCWEAYSDWNVNWNNAILSEALKYKDPKFIMQSEFDILPYLVMNTDILNFLKYSNIKELRKSLKYIKKTFKFSKSALIFNSKLRDLFRFFVNIPKWENFIRTRDFCYGMRIHGSIIALKQGVPAMTIVPDSRILEMSELYKIPHIKVSDIQSSDFSLRKFYEEADYSEMNKIYPKLLENYIDFLNRNGLKHKF